MLHNVACIDRVVERVFDDHEGGFLRPGACRPRRAGAPANELEPEGGNDVSIEKHQIFIGPDEGAYLPVLDIVHKVTAEVSGGSLTIEEWGLPPGVMITPHTHSREDECNYVLKGELKCDVGGGDVVPPARPPDLTGSGEG